MSAAPRNALPLTALDRARPWVVAMVIAAVATLALLAVGWASLRGPFYLDTEGYFRSVPYFGERSLTWEKLGSALFSNPYPAAKRPIPNLTFLVENRLFGMTPASGRVINLLLHGLNVGLAFLLLRLLALQVGLHERGARSTALWGALLWGLNPFHADAVYYVIQRMTLLSATFYLLGVLCFIFLRQSDGAPRWAWGGALMGCFAAGVASKESGVLLLLGLVLVAWLVPQPKGVRETEEHRLWLLGTCMAALALPIVAAAFLDLDPVGLFHSAVEARGREFTVWERLLTEGRVLVHYLTLFFLPLPDRLAFVLKYPVSQSLILPFTTALAWSAIIALCGWAVRIRKRWPFVSLAILWFFGNHLIESTVLPLEIAFVHRNYLPSLFLFVPLAGWLASARGGTRNGRVKVAGGLVLLLFAAGWYPRAIVWGSSEQFWTDAIEKAPGSIRGYLNLGIIRDVQGRPAEALEIYQLAEESAFEETPVSWSALYCCMGIASMNLGDHVEAKAQMERALATAPLPDCLLNKAKLEILLEKPAQAHAALNRLDEVRPRHRKLHLLRAKVLLLEGRVSEARGQLHQELALYPADTEARLLLDRLGSRP